MQAPPLSGSQYFNYKDTHSIVLLAVADANANFVYVDVGAFGRQSDGSVFRNSSLGKALANNTLDLPPPTPLPHSEDGAIPYFFVGDEAFPLMENLMRSFPGQHLALDKRIFNYRLSKARLIVENSFGILTAKWRVFKRPLAIAPHRADSVVKAACCLHNFLRYETSYCNPNDLDEERNGQLIPGSWREDVASLQKMSRTGRRSSMQALAIRDKLKMHLVNEGALDWQQEYVNRCT